MKVFERLVKELATTEELQDYKYIKKGSRFIRKYDWGYYAVDLNHWSSYDYVCIRPVIGFHNYIIVKWFEKYSALTLRDQRSNFLSFMNPLVIGLKGNTPVGDIYEINSDGSDYKETSAPLIHAVTESIRWMEKKYKSLDDYYRYDVAPYLSGEKELPKGGADWFFEGLTACRIVAPEDYAQLKKLFMAQADWMIHEWKYAPEPNMEKYYDRLDEIFSDLETRFPMKK